MKHIIADTIAEHRNNIYLLLRAFAEKKRRYFLSTDIWEIFQQFAKQEGKALMDTEFSQVMKQSQEGLFDMPWFFLLVRPRVGEWQFFRFHVDELLFDQVNAREFLKYKEKLVDGHDIPDEYTLELDLEPFNREFPMMKETRSIGRGVEFLNRHLSSLMFRDKGKGNERLLTFLTMHTCQEQQLMLSQNVESVADLQKRLRKAEGILRKLPPDTRWSDFQHDLGRLGFEPGWGSNALRVLESFNLLIDILEAPDPRTLSEFLSRIPMIFDIIILSPHGYFGQSNVLGMPDTGGQVVYILDQIRALEKEIYEQVNHYGLAIEPRILVLTRLIPNAGKTTCDQREEHIVGSNGAKIIRIPFRDSQDRIIPHWISRFDIYPYLERFALDAEKEIFGQLGKRPDVIIGNYTDGNLVASLLSKRMGVTQCNIAHALEKTKYLYSDLYWQELEREHHFSCQFTADLVSMNTADFIITSTYQEIAGNASSLGQYESYTTFTMPGLYRVLSGINVFDPKFNIVSPGANPDIFFPYKEKKDRFPGLIEDIDRMVRGDASAVSRGKLADPDKPLLFSMARLDVIKNLVGLAEWFGKNQALREKANLLLVAGYVNPAKSRSREEKEQIEKLHKLMDDYQLDSQLRWLEMQTEKQLVGELYRYVADKQGAFVQPALFEAFGLTVIEAMTTGLPVFATRYGGPAEIIEHGVSGFHIDPNHGDAVTDQILQFLLRCEEESGHWQQISHNAITRIASRYTWKLYAHRFLSLAKIYGFWKYVSNLDREESRRYLEMFYSLMFRPRSQAVLEQQPQD